MNDLLNNTTKPQNIEELYYRILKIVETLYDNNIASNIKNRKNLKVKGPKKRTIKDKERLLNNIINLIGSETSEKEK